MDKHLKKTLILLSFCSFFVGLDAIITAPLIPEIVKTININKQYGALLVTSYALLYFFTSPIFGAISDQIGRRKVLLAGIGILGLGTILTGLASNFLMIIICRGITGMGAGMLQPMVFAIISDLFSYNNRGKALGIINGALVGSTLIGVPLGTFVAQILSWRITFWGNGMLILLLLVVITILLPKEERAQAINKRPSFRKQLQTAIRNPSVFLALLGSFLWYSGLQGVMSNIGIYYDQYHIEVGTKGLILMLAGAGSVAGSIYGGRMADKYGKKAVFKWAGIGCALGVLSVTSNHRILVLAIFTHLVWSTAFGIGQTTLTALISDIDPQAKGTVLSLNSSAMYIGMVFAASTSIPLLSFGSFIPLGLFYSLLTILVLPVITISYKDKAV
jgi:multidrug resistance protein